MRLYLQFLIGACASVRAWNCEATIDDIKFDLTALAGDYSVSVKHNTPPTVQHKVYTINPCGSISTDKALKSEEQCKSGTQVCRTTKVEKDDKFSIIEVVAFASDASGTPDAELSRLKTVSSTDQEGLRAHLYGGLDGDGQEQSAVIDFICDRKEDKGEPSFTVDQSGIVKFKWHTKYACEKSSSGDKTPESDEPKRSASWGFFTWFFLVVFMAIATFLIFTLFLNYNRYGQMGLDLVPAMDSFKVDALHAIKTDKLRIYRTSSKISPVKWLRQSREVEVAMAILQSRYRRLLSPALSVMRAYATQLTQSHATCALVHRRCVSTVIYARQS